MRLAWYAGASTAVAASVVISAFHQRSNFYSAMVYLSQSSFCLLVLVNFVLMVYAAFMFGLQRLCFGQLRPVETEQLYERTWYAITETLLAMTMFRDDIGPWFLVMFTALVTGRVWGWIGDGRVEILEQQPPTNPRLFHTRLTISLLASLTYDFSLFHYALVTVIDQAKPTMMVMFLFEFAILFVQSLRTAARYIISVYDHLITTRQTRDGLLQRRREVSRTRGEILRRRDIEGPDSPAHNEELPHEDDVDEIDIEVPGWESKGLYILGLELVTDLLKCAIYVTFFMVLLIFYTMPLHIMRDLFFTFRSLLKRVNAIVKYRKAVRDMERYGDATEEDLARENTCIICREEMRPWRAIPGAVERTRPKKLPCGHILHFGCLKSWLERQQVCPTCRRSVTDPTQDQAERHGDGGNPGGDEGQDPAANQENNRGEPGQAPRNRGMRVFNIGPIRVGFAQGNPQQLQEMADRFNADLRQGHNNNGINEDGQLNQHADNRHNRNDSSHNGGELPTTTTSTQASQPTGASISSMTIRAQLASIEQQIVQEMQVLQQAYADTQTLRTIEMDLARMRRMHQPASPEGNAPHAGPASPQTQPTTHQIGPIPGQSFHPYIQLPPIIPPRVLTPTVTRHVRPASASAIPAGSSDLPEGVVIPPGWSLLPLQRVDGGAQSSMTMASLQSSQQVSHLMQQHLNTLQAQQQHQQTLSSDSIDGSNVQSVTPAGANASSAVTPATANHSTDSSGASMTDTGAAGPSSTLLGSRPVQPGLRSEMAAPTPVLPNWGGRSQLFGAATNNDNNTGAEPLLGQNEESGSSHLTAPSHDANSEQVTATTSTSPSDAVGRQQISGSNESSGNDETPPSNNAKGKARAVTVEDITDPGDE